MTEQTLRGIETSIDINRGAVLVKFNTNDPDLIEESLHRFFDSLKDRQITQILVDMHGVDEPTATMIALLIAETVKMRRRGGDLKILNLSDKSRSHYSFFTPLTYLSIGADSGLIGHLGEDTSLEMFDLGKTNMIRVEASVEALNEATEFVLERAVRIGLDKIELSKLKIAVYEAAMNIIEHSYEFEPEQYINVEMQDIKNGVKVTLSDKGTPFNIYNNPDYDVESAFNEKREGGFGLYIIRRSVDEIHYESDIKSGNRLTLVKYL
ncbi:ATP-binding protein [bacterium]|nr:ATP-binding protein [bacterium]